MPRLFIAIDIPDAIKAQLITLRTDLPSAKWVEKDSIHLTLRFIGDADAKQTQAIKAALSNVKATPFEFTLAGAGRFPPGTNKPPRVLWVKVQAPPTLGKLANDIERMLATLGFAPEERGFSPHITLARFKSRNFPIANDSSGREVWVSRKDSTPIDAAQSFISQHSNFHTAPIRVNEFVLYNSTLTPQGSIYQPEAVYPLRSEE
jgi:RNA 2',3'-cyclic 3'-phosphodiesterase